MENLKKIYRQRLIKKIILQNDVESQEELMNLLEKSGTITTQATISRDIKELHIVKEYQDNGKTKYTLFSQEDLYSLQRKLENSLRDSVLRIECIQFIVILHTNPKSADVVTNFLDEVNFEEISGTIAGIDTVLIITYNPESALIVKERLEKIVGL